MSRSEVRVIRHPEMTDTAREMASDVREGLQSTPKDLSPWPKYFYDAEGSRLFEEITRLPEYYQTRTELKILLSAAQEIVTRSGCQELIELGAGSSLKTCALLDVMAASNHGAFRYTPLDVSESALQDGSRRLLESYPEIEIQCHIGDFDHSLTPLLSSPPDGPRLIIFLGGTIGNFTPGQRLAFLKKLRSGMRQIDYLLIGMDLVKDPPRLVTAYDDATGITARFNKNLLNVLNARLGGCFDPDLFDHRAIYNPAAERMEMWLTSKVQQRIPVKALNLTVSFDSGEGMRTEISSKFTPESAARTLDDAGLELTSWHTDPEDLFALALARPRK